MVDENEQYCFAVELMMRAPIARSAPDAASSPADSRLDDPSDLAQIRAMRCCPADRVERLGADEQVEVGTQGPERVIAGDIDLDASLPPAVFADGHARVQVAVEPSTGAHGALRRLDRYPVASGNAPRPRRRGMQLHFRMPGAFAQARQRAM